MRKTLGLGAEPRHYQRISRMKSTGMRRPPYKSSIATNARERITKRFPSGGKETAEYRLGRGLVGIRWFFETGEPEFEEPRKNGELHGIKYCWHGPGLLSSAEPYVDGLPHGTARQWDTNGRLIGTYRMVRGTGIDLWRQPLDDGRAYLSEVLYLQNGRRHGYEWWLEEDQSGVFIERHWHAGQLHGIEREWNRNGRLRRGYPKYHVRGNPVTKRQYLKAAAADPTLPPFRLQDNKPARIFPAEIARHLAR
jgi:antitoxin component YwqK of YwqJK toxin-antitoxin module